LRADLDATVATCDLESASGGAHAVVEFRLLEFLAHFADVDVEHEPSLGPLGPHGHASGGRGRCRGHEHECRRLDGRRVPVARHAFDVDWDGGVLREGADCGTEATV